MRWRATVGLMYAPDPGSGAYCRIGGNLAMNAAGPRCVKYGATRDHVLGLRAVTGDGREIRVGGRTTKYATAYDLTRSAGRFGRHPGVDHRSHVEADSGAGTVATLRVCYASNASACAAVSRGSWRSPPILPSALEFMDRRAIEAIREYGAPKVCRPAPRPC
jgi:D-lactate dehydrogenase (quinone)